MKNLNFKIKKAFTLAELMVVIAIIAILTIGVININFTKMSKKQKLEIFSNKIISKIETTINNALLGKGIGADLYTPQEWKVEISENGSGNLITSYLSGSSRYNYQENSMNIDFPYSITDIECIKLNGSTGSLTSSTGTIFIKHADISLSGCTDSSYKILKLNTNLLSNEKSIEINTLNGIMRMY